MLKVKIRAPLLAFLSVFFMIACSNTATPLNTQKQFLDGLKNESNTSTQTATSKETYSDEIEFLKLGIKANIKWIKKSTQDDAELVIHFDSTPTQGFLMIKPWMKEMNPPHGAKWNCFSDQSTPCTITEDPDASGKKINQQFRVKGISFPMKGNWEVHFIFKESKQPDSARIDTAILAVTIENDGTIENDERSPI